MNHSWKDIRVDQGLKNPQSMMVAFVVRVTYHLPLPSVAKEVVSRIKTLLEAALRASVDLYVCFCVLTVASSQSWAFLLALLLSSCVCSSHRIPMNRMPTLQALVLGVLHPSEGVASKVALRGGSICHSHPYMRHSKSACRAPQCQVYGRVTPCLLFTPWVEPWPGTPLALDSFQPLFGCVFFHPVLAALTKHTNTQSEFFDWFRRMKQTGLLPLFFDRIGICVFTPFNLKLAIHDVTLLLGVDLTKSLHFQQLTYSPSTI